MRGDGDCEPKMSETITLRKIKMFFFNVHTFVFT